MFHFAYDTAGHLRAEECSLEAIADEVSTPTFVYAQATLERHYRVFDDAFAGHDHLVCYSVKANSHLALLELFGRLGSGADVVSRGELVRALRSGIPATKIVFSGVGKTSEEMTDGLEAGVLAFNVESEGELRRLDDVARSRGRIAPVSLRVNPDVDAKTHPYIATALRDSKFGIPIEDAGRLAREASAMKGVELTGIDCHIGSQLTTIEPLLEALDSVLALADDLEHRGHPIRDLDLGGGLGIPYSSETPPHPSDLGRAVLARMKGRRERLILEPGRVIVGNAGILLTRVIYVKHSYGRTIVIVDAAMNDLIRPSLYGAHHEIWPVVRKCEGDRVMADVVGPICESGDCFAKNRAIEPCEPGDLLAIMSAGAYGFSMASTYNSRPRAAEVLVHHDRFQVIRARERVEALFAGEVVPDWFRASEEEKT